MKQKYFRISCLFSRKILDSKIIFMYDYNSDFLKLVTYKYSTKHTYKPSFALHTHIKKLPNKLKEIIACMQ